jgi:hypothetical protein
MKKLITTITATALTLAIATGALSASAAEPDQSVGASSVSLNWLSYEPTDKSTWIQREVIVEKSAPNTYFSIVGNWAPPFYLGIQQLGASKMVALFSAWDVYADNNCTTCSAPTQNYGLTTVVKLGDGVRGGRFGAEGTGAQAFIDDLNWKIGDRVQVVIHLLPVEGGTQLSSAIRVNDGPWRFFATYKYPKYFANLEPGYSFIEDFGSTPNQERAAVFQNSWMESEYSEAVSPMDMVMAQPNPTNKNHNFHKAEARPFGAWIKSGGAADYSETGSYPFEIKANPSNKISDEAKTMVFTGQPELLLAYNSKMSDLARARAWDLATAKIIKAQKLAKKYPTCAALNKVAPGGIAKSVLSFNTGSRVKLDPEISAKGYQLNIKLDRDKDGIACER